MMRLRKLAVAVATTFVTPVWAGGDYANIYFFGDSLTDSGAFTALVGPGANKFSSNSGGAVNTATTWGENLGARLGLAVTPGMAFNGTGFTATGGNNYAIGGARVTSTPGVFGASAAIASAITPIGGQLAANLAQTGGTARADALYAYWGGANDVFYQAGLVGAGAATTTEAGNAVVAAGAAAATQIASLKAAGARSIVVMGLPDMGVNPYASSIAASGGNLLLTGLSSAYNTGLTTYLMAAGAANVLYLDPRPLMADILARPAAYGVTNTTIPACGTASSLGCVPPAATAGFFFADGVHPGTAVHGILSDWVYSTLAAPARFGMLASLPIGRSGTQWRAMDDRLRGFETDTRTDARGWFATVDYAPTDLDARSNIPSLSGQGKSLTVGVDNRWDRLIGGIALGVADNSFDMGGGAGSIDSMEMILSAFGAAKFGAAYVDALVSYGNFAYDTRRQVAASTNSGNTDAGHFGFKLGVGYNFTSGALTHGPLAALSYERVSVEGFDEKGPTALAVSKQTHTSLRHRIGWQAVWRTLVGETQVSPYLRVTHEREYKDNQALPTISQVGSGFAFSTPTNGARDNWGAIAAGASVKVGGATMQLGVTSNFAQSGVRNRSVAVGIGMPF